MATPVIELFTIECACCKTTVKAIQGVDYCLTCLYTSRPSFEAGMRKLEEQWLEMYKKEKTNDIIMPE